MKKSEIKIGMYCQLDGETVKVTGLDGVNGQIIVEGENNGEEAVHCGKLKPIFTNLLDDPGFRVCGCEDFPCCGCQS